MSELRALLLRLAISFGHMSMDIFLKNPAVFSGTLDIVDIKFMLLQKASYCWRRELCMLYLLMSGVLIKRFCCSIERRLSFFDRSRNWLLRRLRRASRLRLEVFDQLLFFPLPCYIYIEQSLRTSACENKPTITPRLPDQLAQYHPAQSAAS